MTLALQRVITRTLKAQKAQKLTNILGSSPNFSTRAIEASYIAFAHTNCEGDIRNMAGFIPVAQYGQRQPFCPEEIGSVEDVRYVLSPDLAAFADGGGAKAGSGTTMISTSGTSADVYPILFVGKEALGSVPLKGKEAITPMVVNMKPSASDPLAQRGSVGWKTYYAAVRLNENWLVRGEVAATA